MISKIKELLAQLMQVIRCSARAVSRLCGVELNRIVEIFVLLLIICCSVAVSELINLLRASPDGVDAYQVTVAFLQIAVWDLVIFIAMTYAFRKRFTNICPPDDFAIRDLEKSMADGGIIESGRIEGNGRVIRIFGGPMHVILHYDIETPEKYRLSVYYRDEAHVISNLLGFNCKEYVKRPGKFAGFVLYMLVNLYYSGSKSELYKSTIDGALSWLIGFAGRDAVIACSAAFFLVMLGYCTLKLLGVGVFDMMFRHEEAKLRLPKYNFMTPEFLEKLYDKGIQLVSASNETYFFQPLP